MAGASPLTTRADTFNYLVLWEDYTDLDVFRVGDVYYYSSSTFAFSPGAPVLKSYDLINWTSVSHSIPTLNFGSQYDLNGSRAYVKGVWASTLRYRKSTDTFYWMECISGGQTYIWTASSTNAGANNGEVLNWDWKARGTIPRCYYDNGLLIDDDDTMYMVYGSTKIMVAQLSKDSLSEVKTQQILVDSIAGPLSNAGNAHHGGIVDTKDGKWYYVAFLDSYPGGRISVVAPLTWSADGWPSVVRVDNEWGKFYPMPVKTSKTVPPPTGLDTFKGSSLSAEWGWNHNPDTSRFSLLGGSGGLRLRTATVTNDLFSARNTLTHRILGPKSSETFRLDISKMSDGDCAGAILFRDVAAYIGMHKEGGNAKLVMVNNLNLNSDWTTNSTGSVAATGPTIAASSTDLWLSVQSDITPAFGTSTSRASTFWYSTDGNTFTQLGATFLMTNTWQFFTGYRFGVLNFATKALGGKITLKSFELKALQFRASKDCQFWLVVGAIATRKFK
ncbi:Arabinanase/levansucrase/invertase [Setomelanomma holmii]|uniref:Arabinanase/levansucrase/invertase n=1 Tax=Setomelanomma holmii TaxID=210430 RepID=A0A9P4H3T9_9PLEO|nr:Arabinanase/levansucrase/invertase [Setomelanomma holmii]